jgi:hypothetical protein
MRADGSTPRESRHDYWGVVLEAPDARTLARFYAEMLEWEMQSEDPSFATVAPADGGGYLGFQTSPEHVSPVWPAVEGEQQCSSTWTSRWRTSRRRSTTRRSSARARPDTNRRRRFG